MSAPFTGLTTCPWCGAVLDDEGECHERFCVSGGFGATNPVFLEKVLGAAAYLCWQVEKIHGVQGGKRTSAAIHELRPEILRRFGNVTRKPDHD